MKFFERIPIPLSGVALGFAALGNLLQSYSETVRYCCGAISVIFLLGVLLKVFFCFTKVKEEIKNPVNASVGTTFPMALMLLSVYAKPLFGGFSMYFWYFAIGLHMLFLILFTVKFLLKLDIKKVFASYYIVYVGIAVASITAPAYKQLALGTYIFWFGFVSFVLLFVLVTYRYLKFPEMPEPTKPLVCITAAPMSLLLAGYVQSVTDKNTTFMLGMLIVSVVLWLLMLILAAKFILEFKFFPSFASFTFPFVISAIATKQAYGVLGEKLPMFMSSFVLVQTVLAVLLCCFVLVKFLVFLFTKQNGAFKA